MQQDVTNSANLLQNGYITTRHPTDIEPDSAFDHLLEPRNMDANRLQELLRNYLAERPRNTAEISSWLNEMGISSPSGAALAAALEKDESIIRIGRVRRSGMVRAESPLSEWATEEWVEHHERDQSKTKE